MGEIRERKLLQVFKLQKEFLIFFKLILAERLLYF